MNTMNKFLSVLISLTIVLFFSIDASSSNITNYKTPISEDKAQLKWSLKLGNNYKTAPSTVAIVGNTLLIMSGKTLYKIDKNTGKTISTAEMVGSPSYGTVSVTYADGVIYCPLGSGQIQAFSYDEMQSLWVYKDEIGGQSLTPIKFDNGCIYTGFWKSEDKYANYVCIDVTDESESETHESKQAEWTFASLGGFYWAGCEIINDYIVFGCDNGTDKPDDYSKVLCLNKATGQLIDSVTVIGDQRSTITVSDGKLFFATKAGYLHSVDLLSDGTFDDSSLKTLKLGGSATASPVIYNGRLYIGVQGEEFGKGYVRVINAEDLKVIYSVTMKGYPQNTVLVSDAYYNETGRLYIYSTYNAYPGGITVITDSAEQTSAVSQELFTPPENMAEYSISTIVADENGVLYYKNDSGNIFAIETMEHLSLFSRLVNLFRNIINFFRSLFVLTEHGV